VERIWWLSKVTKSNILVKILIYKRSFKNFNDAKDLTKSLSKKQISEENAQIKLFLNTLNNDIKSKLKLLESLIQIKQNINNNSNQILETSAIPSRISYSSVPTKINNLDLLPRKKNEHYIENIDKLLYVIDKDVKELEENKKNIYKSIFLDTTTINQNSFFLPNVNLYLIKLERTFKNATN
jgi:hypothetical protein